MKKILFTLLALAASALLILGAPSAASAHTKNIDVTCDSITVNLSAYQSGRFLVAIDNQWVTPADGQNFQHGGSWSYQAPNREESFRWAVHVQSYDGIGGGVWEGKSKPCPAPEPEPTVTPTPEPTPEPTVEPTPEPTETPKPTPPAVTNPPTNIGTPVTPNVPKTVEPKNTKHPRELAETGPEDPWIIAGLVAAGAAAIGVGLWLFRRRPQEE